jgi:hypothetical protein
MEIKDLIIKKEQWITEPNKTTSLSRKRNGMSMGVLTGMEHCAKQQLCGCHYQCR